MTVSLGDEVNGYRVVTLCVRDSVFQFQFDTWHSWMVGLERLVYDDAADFTHRDAFAATYYLGKHLEEQAQCERASLKNPFVEPSKNGAVCPSSSR